MFKRIISLIFIFILVGINNDLLIVTAKPSLVFPNVELDNLKRVADFKLITPSSVLSYKLEIKNHSR